MNKKLSLFLSLILSSFVYLAAQSIDYTVDGRHFYVASPNGRYFSGTVEEGPGCLFDAYTKQHFVTDIDSINISAVNNDGIACGSRMGKAGVWVRGKEWKMITALSTINGKPIESSEICGMSADATKYIALMRYDGGKATPVFCEVDKFENWDNDAAWEFSTLPTPTKDDLFYNMNPQFVQVCGMNYDATRILGRYVLSDGKRQVPFIWQKAPEGVWELNFVAERCLFNQEAIEGMTRLLEKESFDNALDYDVYRQGLESGIIYDLAPYTSFAWSGNGRYIPLSANIAVDGSAEGVYYAAVIDIDMDTLIIFTAVKDAGPNACPPMVVLFLISLIDWLHFLPVLREW